MNNPIFIIGAQRSGTTLLRLMLNTHSQIAIPEEGTFWMPLLRKYKKNGRNKIIPKRIIENHCSYIAKNAQFKLWHLDAKSFLSDIQCNNKATFSDLMTGLYENYCKSHGKKIWGDKTPSFFRMIPIISKLYPNARFIHIIRDGRDLFLSWKKIDPTKSNIAVTSLEWKHKVHKAQRDLKLHAHNRHIEIRYEDLASTPAKTLLKVTNFLHVPFEQEMLNFWEKSKDFIGTHHSKLIFKPPSISSVNKWENKLTTEELYIFEVIAGDCLKENDYPTKQFVGKYNFFKPYFKLLCGIPARVGQIAATRIKLGLASKLGVSTNAAGGR